MDSEPIQVIRMEIQNNPIFQFEIDGTLQEVASLKELSVGEIFHIEEEDIAIVWLYNGTGALGFDAWGGIYMLGNDFLYAPGDHELDLAQVSEGTRVFLLMIRKPILARIAEQVLVSADSLHSLKEILSGLGKDGILFHWPHSAQLISCMEILIADFGSPLRLGEILLLDLIRLLERILSIEEKEFAPVHSATHTNAVMYIVKFIRENFATATLNDIAESLHYSPAYLSQILKENLGMNFNQLLDLRRSVVGRKLLLETKKSLEDTALELGFQSYSGFYKFWVKQQGLSPKEYRERYSKENVKIDKKIRRIR